MTEDSDAKTRMIATEVCREEMERCVIGSDNSNRLDNAERRIIEMAGTIKEGFKDIADKLATRDEKKDSKVFAIIQILLTAFLTAMIAWKLK